MLNVNIFILILKIYSEDVKKLKELENMEKTAALFK